MNFQAILATVALAIVAGLILYFPFFLWLRGWRVKGLNPRSGWLSGRVTGEGFVFADVLVLGIATGFVDCPRNQRSFAMDQLSIYLPGIALAHAAVMLALMSPGPNILAVIGTSMGVGRREGIALALGVGCGTLLWVLLAVVGFTAVIATYATVMKVLKVLGGLYLLWLGYKAFRSAVSTRDIHTTIVSLDGRWSSYFLRGLTVQMTNPKAALAMIAIVSLGVHTGAPMWVGASIVIGTSTLSLCAHLLYAVTFSTKPMVALYSKARRAIQATLGAFFCAAGIRLLTERN